MGGLYYRDLSTLTIGESNYTKLRLKIAMQEGIKILMSNNTLTRYCIGQLSLTLRSESKIRALAQKVNQ